MFCSGGVWGAAREAAGEVVRSLRALVVSAAAKRLQQFGGSAGVAESPHRGVVSYFSDFPSQKFKYSYLD